MVLQTLKYSIPGMCKMNDGIILILEETVYNVSKNLEINMKV